MTDFERLLDTSEKISDRQYEMNLTLVRLTTTVEEHVRRTNLLEDEIKTVREDLQPIAAHVTLMQNTGKNVWLLTKIIGIVGAVIGTLLKVKLRLGL